MGEEEKKKGFTVTDRRVKLDEETKPQPESTPSQEPPPEQSPEQKTPKPPPPMAEISFASFIMSLNTSALIHLGLLPDPLSGKVEQNLELAKQTIDLLGILKEKTKGNLTQEEQDLLDNLLFDLRIKYVDLSSK